MSRERISTSSSMPVHKYRRGKGSAVGGSVDKVQLLSVDCFFSFYRKLLPSDRGAQQKRHRKRGGHEGLSVLGSVQKRSDGGERVSDSPSQVPEIQPKKRPNRSPSFRTCNFGTPVSDFYQFVEKGAATHICVVKRGNPAPANPLQTAHPAIAEFATHT